MDPVLYWDNRSGTTGTKFADRLLAAAQKEGVAIRFVHAHADHITATATSRMYSASSDRYSMRAT